MSRTFIVKEVQTRTWRVEFTDQELKRLVGGALPLNDDELDYVKLSAADFIDEPDPERGTITLLSAGTTVETDEDKG